MNYARIYNQLIERAKARTRPEGYVERHHVTPRCMGGSDERSNLVYLTAREHFLAHLLLAKVYGGKLWKAIHRMAHNMLRQKSKMYERARVEHAKLMVEVGRKNATKLMEEFRGVTARSKEKMREDGKKGNREGKKKSGETARDQGLGIFSAGPELKSEWAKLSKGGINNYEKNKNNPESIFTFQSRSLAGKKGIAIARLQRFKCSVCGLVSDPGGIASHQRFKKHIGKERVS